MRSAVAAEDWSLILIPTEDVFSAHYYENGEEKLEFQVTFDYIGSAFEKRPENDEIIHRIIGATEVFRTMDKLEEQVRRARTEG